MEHTSTDQVILTWRASFGDGDGGGVRAAGGSGVSYSLYRSEFEATGERVPHSVTEINLLGGGGPAGGGEGQGSLRRYVDGSGVAPGRIYGYVLLAKDELSGWQAPSEVAYAKTPI